MESIDLKTLEEAVTVFYRSDSQQQAAAHDWLNKVQCSPQAWSLVWDLMQIGKSSEIQFYGATTLHTKLMKYWHEVPKENRNELKQKLLETIIMYGNGPKIVLNRLCIALSAFVVHMLPEWPTAIEEVVSTFQNQQLPNINPTTQMWILMEVLGAIPEETNAIFTSVQRVAIRAEINKRTPFVVNIIQQIISSKCDGEIEEGEMDTLLRTVKCAEAWIKNGTFPLNDCDVLTTALLKLINKCYWASTQSDGCMSAEENDLSETCIKALTAILIQPDAHRYANTALNILNTIVDSLSNITKNEWKTENSNEDIAFNIYTLFISSIECHSRLLIAGVLAESAEHRSLYVRLIQEILQCTDKPGIYPVEESCSVLAMGFWYMLQDEILSMENAVEKAKCLELIVPLYSHLAKILVRKAQQPDETALECWANDDLETFRCYRQDISDTLLYCYEVLHDHLLQILAGALDECVTAIQQDAAQWTQLEACIYAFYSIAEHVESSERKCVPKFIMILNEIPYAKLNERVLGTALDSIGAYSEWFKENANYLPSAIQLLVVGLNSTQAAQATLGLKDLCRECQIELHPFAEPLLQACQRAIALGHLKNSEMVRLMFSIGKVMSMLPQEQLVHWLDAVVSPCFEELRVLTQNRNMTESAEIRTLFRMNMISTLFSSLNTKVSDGEQPIQGGQATVQPVLIVMQKTMPIFKDVATIWINENVVIEALCTALKFAITNLLDDFKPMLPDLCNLIITIFQSKCVPPAVEIAKTCIILFYKDDQCTQIMRQLIAEVTMYNFQLFERTPEAEISNIADVVETFYSFNAQIAKKLPQAFADANVDCVKLLHFAAKALTLPETGCSKQAVLFLMHFILQSRNYPNLTSAILSEGERIVHTTLLCIGAMTLRTHVDVFADVFVAFNKKYPAELIAWMKILEMTDFPTNLVSSQEKEQFMKSVLKEKVNKRLVQGHIREFAAKSRGVLEKTN